MKHKIILAIPVGIAAIALGCEPKNDLVQVKGSMDTLKNEWFTTDSLINSLALNSKTDVTAFQQSFLTLSSDEAISTIKDLEVKADVDSMMNIADLELKEAVDAAATLDTLINEWKVETEQLTTLAAQIEKNEIPADSAEMKVDKLKIFLSTTGIKTAQINEAILDAKKKHEVITSEINKKVNPSTN